MKKLLIILAVFILCVPSVAIAAIYYVDANPGTDCSGTYSIANRTCTGTDGNSYNTVQEAVNVAVAGDTIYIRSGTYTENITMKASGTSSENVITISEYSGDTAVIVGKILLSKMDYLTFNGLEITGADYGFYESASEGSAGSDFITINNCYIHNMTSNGIYIARGTDATITNCIIEDYSGTSGILSYGLRMLIEDTIIGSPKGTSENDGIKFSRTYDNANTGHIVRRCYIHDIDGESGAHSDAIQLVEAAGVLVEYTVFENCKYVIMSGAITGHNDNFIFRYNMDFVTDDNSWTSGNGAYRVTIESSRNFEVVGNTFGECPSSSTINPGTGSNYTISGALHIYNSTVTCSGIVKNNIFYKLPYYNGTSELTGVTFDYNTYYGSYSNLSSNYDTGSESEVADPLFVSDDISTYIGSRSTIIASNLYKLSYASPCRNTGTSYSGSGFLSVDLYGNTTPLEGAWDRGAYEYGTGTTPPSATGCTIQGGTFK